MTDTVRLVCFGNGGDTVAFADGSHCSGYGTPDNPHAAEFAHERKTNVIVPDGTPVIDKRPAIETEAGFSWVFRGPMVNVNLPDGDIDRCVQPSGIMREAVKNNPYGGVLALHEATKTEQKAGALDRVSVSEYVAGWAAVGARVGHYENRRIVWDD